MEVEMELEKEHFSALYSCAFPAKKGAVIRAWTKMSGGWESDLFLVNLNFEEEGEQRSEEAVLKLYHPESAERKPRFTTAYANGISGATPPVLFYSRSGRKPGRGSGGFYCRSGDG